MRRDCPSYSVSEVGFTNCPFWILFLQAADLVLSIDTDPTVVEGAVKYIIFLVDADRLFDTALGMYDFNLVLMIAQHAQKVGFLFDHTSKNLTDSHYYFCCVSASLL